MFRKKKNDPPKVVRIVQVGNTKVGKTCLLSAYQTGVFKQTYEPTDFDFLQNPVLINKKTVNAHFHDSSGSDSDHLTELRSTCYGECHAAIIMYAVNDEKSYNDVVMRWIPEVRKFLPTAPIIVVATKTDLKDNRSVNFEIAKDLLESNGVSLCLESSAAADIGVRNVYQKAAEIAYSTAYPHSGGMKGLKLDIKGKKGKKNK